MPTNVKPMAMKIPCLLLEVAPLNNNMAPTSPRNNVAVPAITVSKDRFMTYGRKMPDSSTKNPSR